MSNLAESQYQRKLFVERSQKRWNLVYYLRVYNTKNNDLVGHLVDLTTEGLMLISESPIPTNHDYSLKMEIPQNGDFTKTVDLRARSLWTKPDVNPHFHDTGFKLINPSKQAIEAINRMIDELKLDF